MSDKRICAALWVAALLVYVLGIRQNLPYTPEGDEYPAWVAPALHMVADGTLDPGWYGHPGSTGLYPMAAAYRLGYGADAALDFAQRPTAFYLIARFISILYASLCVPAVYLLGSKVFNRPVGALGSLMMLTYAIAIGHAQVARSDSAAAFFSVMALWAMTRLREQPSYARQAQAGLWIGLSVSSRYFMALLFAALLAIDLVLLLRAADRRRALAQAAAGGAAALAVFCLTTPAVLINFPALLAGIRIEARSTHVGMDGMAPAANLLWYLADAIPRSITWLQYGLAAAGLAAAARQRRLLPLWLAGYGALFLLAISSMPLHAQRWLIPILPIAALLAGFGLWSGLEWLARRRATGLRQARAFALLGALALAYPAYETATLTVRQLRPTTRVLAREWMLANAPPQSRIIQEWYAAPLGQTAFQVDEKPILAQAGLGPDALAAYDYAIVSSSIYSRFTAEAGKYPAEVAFYQALARYPLVFEAAPGTLRGGSVVRVYKLKP